MMWLYFGRIRSGSILIVLPLTLLFCVDGAAQSVDYARQVQPILHGRCAQCHATKDGKGKPVLELFKSA